MQFEINIERLRGAKIFLGLPLYGGQNFGAFTKSMMDLSMLCSAWGIQLYSYFMFNESLVQRARNYCTDAFLHQSDAEIFMFVDSDIEFNAKDILAMAHIMLERDMDVLCGTYPKKIINWKFIKDAVDRGYADEDPNELNKFVGDYVFSPVKTGQYQLNEPMELSEAGTGFMMIHRRSFQKIAEKFPEWYYKPDHVHSKEFNGSREVYAYFHCDIDPETKRYLSEDYWFCHQARKAGLRIHMAPWVKLKHHGYYAFDGDLAAISTLLKQK